METDYVVAIIGIGGTLLGTVIGFFLTLAYDEIRERKKLRAELQAAINRVLFVGVVDTLPVALNELRQLVIENAQACKRYKGLPEFFGKWLTHPAIQLDREFIGLYPPEKVQELKQELAAVRL